MDDGLVRGLRYMTAQLAVLSAAVHGAVAVPRLSAALASGSVPRVATLLFVLAIAGIVAGIVAVRFRLVSRRTVYALGLLLMLGQVGGWVAYHNLALLGGHSHGSYSVLSNTAAHFLGDPVEAAAKTAETLAAVLLVVLLRVDTEGGLTATLPAARSA
jgi:hypothetical protein